MLLLAPTLVLGQAFDHSHGAWDALLAKYVEEAPDGYSSRVNYRGFADERERLGTYLSTLSKVSAGDYARWSKPRQFAFLANAYNAFTIEKVLTAFPDLKSIRDFGTLIGNPWRDRFFTLLGEKQHLDGIEHEILRRPGYFDDPRVHVALNCASIGCPMLGRRAFTADKLDGQLEDRMRRFLADRTRNRYNQRTKRLELSALFDWYSEDFERQTTSFLGYPGFSSVAEVGARYAELLADRQDERSELKAKGVRIRYLDYDWSLNDLGS